MLLPRIITVHNSIKLSTGFQKYSTNSLCNNIVFIKSTSSQIASHLDVTRRLNVTSAKSFATSASKKKINNINTKRERNDTLHHKNTNDTTNDTTSESNRQQFKNLPVIPSILSYIEKVGIGLPPRGKKKWNKRRTSILDEKSSENSTPPPPFASTGQSHRVSKWRQYSITRNPITSFVILDNKESREEGVLPEIALAGRSNVGKSTLLNALLYSNTPVEKKKYIEKEEFTAKNPKYGYNNMEKVIKELPSKKSKKMKLQLSRGKKAVVSSRPGETRSITTYELTNKLKPTKDESHKSVVASLRLVDLPGYGFAFANEEKAKEWRGAMKEYILHRGKYLKRILLLIDSRHGMKKTDVEFLRMIQDDFKEMELKEDKKDLLPHVQIVLTKCDLMKQVDLARRVSQVKKQLSEVFVREPGKLPLMLVSGQAGLTFHNPKMSGKNGVLELQRELASIVTYR